MQEPRRLLKQYFRLSFVLAFFILFIVTLGIYSIYRANIITNAEEDTQNLANLIIRQENYLLINRDTQGKHYLAIDPKLLPVLDKRMTQYLTPLNMLKIKIFSPSKKIIYSTEKSLIGKSNKQNHELSDALKGQVASELEQRGEVLDLEGEKRFDRDVVEVYVPIHYKKQIMGAAEVYIDVTRYRSQIRQVLFSTFIVLFSVLVVIFGILYSIMRRGTEQLERAQQQLEIMSITDELTLIYNRRYIFTKGQEAFAKVLLSRQKGQQEGSFGLIILDIDYFKTFNDTYGHQLGDKVLKELAQRLLKSKRTEDIVGRYGGEEFLFYLPFTNLEETKNIAEQIRQSIKNTPFYIDGQAYDVTVSMGIASNTNEDNELDDIIKRADDGLYAAKKTGRDKIGCL